MGNTQNNLEMKHHFHSVRLESVEGNSIILSIDRNPERLLLDVEFHTASKGLSAQFADHIKPTQCNKDRLQSFASVLKWAADRMEVVED